MLSTRPSDDELFMEVAYTVAKRSLCDRDRVGAVVVDTQLRIIGTGRNGPPASYPHENQTCSTWCHRALTHKDYPAQALDPTYADCPSLHAEVNALLTSDRSAREGGTIYITSDPCWSCAKMIANSGLTTVVFVSDPVTFVARRTEPTLAFLERLGLNVITMDKEGTGRWTRTKSLS